MAGHKVVRMPLQEMGLPVPREVILLKPVD